MAKTKAENTNRESVAGYFRTILEANPKLLMGKSNEEILRRWLADHPDHTEVPKNVKASLSNIKSVLRSEKRKGGRPKQTEPALVLESATVEVPAPEAEASDLALEHLEEQIDDCLMLARGMDRKGLEPVVLFLRKARNAVVWQLGQ
jgi:hypothetical protein